jgi:hypothetical protein
MVWPAQPSSGITNHKTLSGSLIQGVRTIIVRDLIVYMEVGF